MRLKNLAIIACIAGAVLTPSTSRAETRVGIIPYGTAETEKFVPLLELRLSKYPGVVLVERNAIKEVLREQELQAVLAADAPGKRASLGKMLKADLLVFLAGRDKPKPHVTVVVCETGQGVRLRIEPVILSGKPEDDAEAIVKHVEAAVWKRREKITDIVAVPPLVNNSLTHEADNLQGGLAHFVEQTVLRRPGLLVVELAEAKALAREIVLSGDAKGIERRLPLYLLGEYRAEAPGENRRGQFAWRLVRGEKELGRREKKAVPWDKFPERIRQAATELVDEAAGKAIVRSDPLAEAKNLADRAQTFIRLGEWQRGLDLAEACLMLNSDQPALHGDALRAILEMNAEGDFMRRHPQQAIGALRAGLPHLDAHFRGTIVPFADLSYVQRLRWGYGYRFFPTAPPEYYALLDEMRATADRILTAKAAAKAFDQSLEFLGTWDENSAAFGVADQARTAVARAAWLRKELPALCAHRLKLLEDFRWLAGERDYDNGFYQSHGYYPPYYRLMMLADVGGYDTGGILGEKPDFRITTLAAPDLIPVYVDFYRKVKKMSDPHLRELASRFLDRVGRLPELRAEWQQREASRRKPEVAPYVAPPPVKDPEVVFHKISLRQTTAGGEEEPVGSPPRIENWIPLYKGCDLVCLQYDEVALMKERGHLRVLLNVARSQPVSRDNINHGGHSSTFGNVAWDSQYIWALNPGEEGPLTVIDPRREKLWRAGPKDGLPPSISCAIAPLRPGKVCITGYFGRLWIALASLDANKRIHVEVIHEARDVLDEARLNVNRDLTPKDTSPKLASPVLFAATVTAPAGKDGRAPQRVIIGRSSNSALLVDPETKSVTAESYFMPDCYPLGTESAVYWAEGYRHPGPEAWVGPLYRFGASDFKRELLSPSCLDGRRVLFQGQYHVLARDADFRATSDLYYVAADPKGPFRRLRCNFPVPGRASELFLSSHYGLVLSMYADVYQVELKKP